MAMEALPMRSNEGLSPLFYPYDSSKHSQLAACLLEQRGGAPASHHNSNMSSKGSSILRDELSAQVYLAPPRFMLVTTAGVLEIEKQRPIDLLRQILDLGPILNHPTQSLQPSPPAPSVQEQAHKLLR